MCPAITSSIAGTLPRYGVTDIDARGTPEHFGAEMLRTAIAGGAKGQSRLRFAVGDEFGQRLRGDLRIDDQRERHRGDQRDRRKILHRIVGQLPVERLVDGERGRGRGARLVLDHDGGAETGLKLTGDQAAEKIGAAAGRIGHDHRDGPAGIGRLGPRRQPLQQSQPAGKAGDRRPARQQHGSSHDRLFKAYCFRSAHDSRTTLATVATYQRPPKSNPAFAAVQQPQLRLNQYATLMGYFRENAIFRPCSVRSAAMAEPC